jgi:uncharacterized protein
MTLLSQELIEAIRENFALRWNGVHGIHHWIRVREAAIFLARESGGNPGVAELFAFLHDSCRRSDGCDNGHGERAANFIARLPLEEVLSPNEIGMLQFACRHHTRQRYHDDPTIRCCWDADRLDIERVGLVIDTGCLNSATARNAGTIAMFRSRHRELFLPPDLSHLTLYI